MVSLEEEILAREWFYEFTLPSGAVTRTNFVGDQGNIHPTRLRMMWQVVEPFFGDRLAGVTALDIASHEGYFAYHLARRCRSVLGLEVNPASIAAAKQIRDLYGLSNLEFMQVDLNDFTHSMIQPADLVLAFGIIYHLENPVGVLRRLRSLTRELLLIETQTTMLELSGAIDWGAHWAQNQLDGVFGILAGSPGARDGGTSDIVLVPSREGLLWILRQLGFNRVEVIPPPTDAYQQLLMGRRIMVAAYV